MRGGGTGATRDARSRGESAGSVRPVVVCVGVRPARRVGAAVKPGGGGMIVVERKVRRGLEGMGVPSSSSGVGGREASKGIRGWFGVQGVVMLREAEVAERVLKKGCCCGCDALAVEGER